MRITVQESAIVRNAGSPPLQIVLCKVVNANARPQWVTWVRVWDGDGESDPYTVHGCYFGSTELRYAVKNYEKRCENKGTDPYPIN